MAKKKNNYNTKQKSPVAKKTLPPAKTVINSKGSEKKVIDKTYINLVTAIFIAICGFFLYSRTANYLFVLDDFSVIAENKITMEGSKAIPKIFKTGYREGNYIAQDNLYRPLTKAMFAIEYERSGGKPGPLHWMNIILYSLLCGFIFLALRRFFPGQYYLALIATLLFTFHPIHTEVVSNIKSRDEILSLFFILGSLWFAKSYADSGKFYWILPTALLYFLALFTKESTITYVALLPVSLYFISKATLKQNLILTGSMIGITLLYLYIHVSVIGSIGLTSIPIPDNSIVASKDFMVQRMTAIEILGRYLKLLLFPHPLSCDYSFNTIPLVKTPANIGFLLSVLVHAAGLFYAIKNWKKKSVVSYAIMFYLITISIVSNVFMLIGTNMAERLVFMPSLGFCLLISFFMVKLLKAEKLNPTDIGQIFTKRAAIWAVLIPILVLASIKTYSRTKDWQSVSTLFNKDIKTVPNSVHMLYYHAGMISNGDSLSVKTEQKKKETLELAKKELVMALDIYEPFLDAHAQLGKVYQKLGDYDNGIKHFKRFLEMNDKNPTVYNNYGTCLGFKGDLKGAELNFKKAIEISPICYADAMCNLGATYIFYADALKANSKIDSAVIYYNMSLDMFKKTLECDNKNINANQYSGFVYRMLGDSTKAIPFENRYKELAQSKQQKLSPGK